MRNFILFSCISILSIALAYGLVLPQEEAPTTPFIASALEKPVIVFDIGGVLIDTDHSAVFKKIGFRTLSTYALNSVFRGSFSIGKSIKRDFYTILHRISKMLTVRNFHGARDSDGEILPGLLCAWMTGSYNEEFVYENAQKIIKENPQWFTSSAQKELVSKLLTIIFSPTDFVQTRKILKEGMRLAEYCKKSGYQLVICSNWNAQSYPLVRERFKNLFTLFDEADHLISGNLPYMKPVPEMYETLKMRYGAHRCIIIDDQIENVQAARRAGLNALHYSGHQSCDACIQEINRFSQRMLPVSSHILNDNG